MAVNNLATEMRRANYLNAIGIGGGNTKRPTLYQEFGYWKATEVQITAGFLNILKTAWPRYRYTLPVFPGLRYLQ